MKRVKLKVMGISYSQTQSGAYALILIEENGERRIPIIIGGFEAQAIVIKLENLDPPRPLTHDLFRQFAHEFNISVFEVMIYKLEEGVFFSKLVCNNGEKECTIDSRTSDAVALALRFGCPIFITEEILEKAGITINPADAEIATANEVDSLFEPERTRYESYSDEELYKMIDESVKKEDYERAASVRDEIEKKKEIQETGMRQYLELLDHVIKTGTGKKDRTGTGTISLFGYQMRFNLEEGFPLLTTKKLHLKSIIHELLWFISGDTNTRYLNDNGVKIWNDWADKDGNLGPVYGSQWRSWSAVGGEKIDQLLNVIKSIKKSPDSRRHIVSAWNAGELDKMALPPCHIMFQFYVAEGKLSCQLYQRSADIFLGVPFNIASYSLLTLMVAQATGLKTGDFVHTLGDAHIYINHLDQVKLQLTREPYQLPKMVINPAVTDILMFSYDDFTLTDYVAHPHIKGDISV